MAPSGTNADKLKAFKDAFTKDAVKQFYGGYAQAIAFHEIQLNQIRAMKKDFEKRFEKRTFYDKSVSSAVTGNDGIVDALRKTEINLQHEFSNQIELLESKISFLKTVNK